MEDKTVRFTTREKFFVLVVGGTVVFFVLTCLLLTAVFYAGSGGVIEIGRQELGRPADLPVFGIHAVAFFISLWSGCLFALVLSGMIGSFLFLVIYGVSRRP